METMSNQGEVRRARRYGGHPERREGQDLRERYSRVFRNRTDTLEVRIPLVTLDNRLRAVWKMEPPSRPLIAIFELSAAIARGEKEPIFQNPVILQQSGPRIFQ